MTPEEAFARENICKIYALTDEQYAFLYGEAKAPEEKRPLFEHYVRSGQKLLRCGYTTGTVRRWARRARHVAAHRPHPRDSGPPHPEGHRGGGRAYLLPPVRRGS